MNAIALNANHKIAAQVAVDSSAKLVIWARNAKHWFFCVELMERNSDLMPSHATDSMETARRGDRQPLHLTTLDLVGAHVLALV